MRNFVIKAEVDVPSATNFAFRSQKTMYGGKVIAEGDAIFIFASENEGGSGLIACGVVTSARAVSLALVIPSLWVLCPVESR